MVEKNKEQAKKEKKVEKVRKDKAVIRGKDLPVSTKHAVAICRFIKGRGIEEAVSNLNEVVEKKRAVPMKGELPHRKGKGMERGRYPMKACKIFIKLLKNLAANSSMNGLEEPYIFVAKADKASRPYRRFGSRRFKRTHVYLETREREKKKTEEKGKGETKEK
jgi:ribosomal protein uL22